MRLLTVLVLFSLVFIVATVTLNNTNVTSHSINHEETRHKEETNKLLVRSAELRKYYSNEGTMDTRENKELIALIREREKNNAPQLAVRVNERFIYEDKLTRNHLTTSSVLFDLPDNIKNNLSVNDLENIDLRIPSLLTAHEINVLTLNTPLENLGKQYIEAEKQYGVNASFLLALSIHESNWGKSRISQDKNNIFGYRAYDRDPYLYATAYGNKRESIQEAARAISTNYLSEEGKYFGGNFNALSINKRYATDPYWSVKVARIMKQLDEKLQKYKR